MGTLGGLSEAEARIAELETERRILIQANAELAAMWVEQQQGLRDWQDHLVRIHHVACDYPFRTELPEDYAEVADGCGSSDGRRGAGGAGSLADSLGRAGDAPDGPVASTA